jgi:hypothetical protein
MLIKAARSSLPDSAGDAPSSAVLIGSPIADRRLMQRSVGAG